MKYLPLLLLILSSVPLAQTPAKQFVYTGTVTDLNGAPIAAAQVTLRDKSGKEGLSTTTDGDGAFTLNVPEGKRYSIEIIALGFLKNFVDDLGAETLKFSVTLEADPKTVVYDPIVSTPSSGKTVIEYEVTADPLPSSAIIQKAIQPLSPLRKTDSRTWLRGVLRDDQGAVYPNTDILFTAKSGSFKTKTDENGKYQILLLPERYDITVDGTGKGFKTFKIRRYLIPAYSEMTLDMALEGPPTNIL